VDRIALAPAARGSGTGERLYRELLALLAADPDRVGLPLACEVNTRPANPGSLRFHQRLGFAEIGANDHGDKAVVYLARAVMPAEQQGVSA
jgi:predicted GNAT superfamily acetyltransferase